MFKNMSSKTEVQLHTHQAAAEGWGKLLCVGRVGGCVLTKLSGCHERLQYAKRFDVGWLAAQVRRTVMSLTNIVC